MTDLIVFSYGICICILAIYIVASLLLTGKILRNELSIVIIIFILSPPVLISIIAISILIALIVIFEPLRKIINDIIPNIIQRGNGLEIKSKQAIKASLILLDFKKIKYTNKDLECSFAITYTKDAMYITLYPFHTEISYKTYTNCFIWFPNEKIKKTITNVYNCYESEIVNEN